MKEYQKRVIQEQKDLGEKIIKLTTFIMNFDMSDDNFVYDEGEWKLLHLQLDAMLKYNQVLQERIRLFWLSNRGAKNGRY